MKFSEQNKNQVYRVKPDDLSVFNNIDKRTNVAGFFEDYKFMYEIVKGFYELKSRIGKLAHIGYSMSDLGFHGYKKEDVEKEKEIYNTVEKAYMEFVSALADAIGYYNGKDEYDGMDKR